MSEIPEAIAQSKQYSTRTTGRPTLQSLLFDRTLWNNDVGCLDVYVPGTRLSGSLDNDGDLTGQGARELYDVFTITAVMDSPLLNARTRRGEQLRGDCQSSASKSNPVSTALSRF